LLLTFSLSAQTTERKDSLVRLLGCDELQQVDEYGVQYRKALGHARFEHNSTLLVCDTALWNVNTNVINAFGNVRIIQNSTVLSSESLDYLIDQNLAQFRGSLVQLRDKDGNTLRTRDLDYNTKDSVAVFRGGGALRDKDGQVIESVEGSYFSKLSTFTFTNNVNMYTDSMFVKTDFLSYDTEANRATFGTGTNAWKDDNMLSSKAGLYERNIDKFTFTTDVHLLTEGQEAWADTLVYYRARNEVEMFGHAELLDTSRNVAAVAGYMQYIDSLSYVKMTRDPAVIMISEQDGKKDTVYVGADTLILRSIPKCEVDSVEFVRSEARLKELNVDPITEYRRKAADREGIEIRLYSVIYDCINEVKDGIEGMLEPEKKEEVIATAEVKQTFRISKVGTIAGCLVRDGKMVQKSKVRLIRDGIVVYTGELGSLQVGKDTVKEVIAGRECGLSIAGYNDIKDGDVIEAFQIVEIKRTL